MTEKQYHTFIKLFKNFNSQHPKKVNNYSSKILELQKLKINNDYISWVNIKNILNDDCESITLFNSLSQVEGYPVLILDKTGEFIWNENPKVQWSSQDSLIGSQSFNYGHPIQCAGYDRDREEALFVSFTSTPKPELIKVLEGTKIKDPINPNKLQNITNDPALYNYLINWLTRVNFIRPANTAFYGKNGELEPIYIGSNYDPITKKFTPQYLPRVLYGQYLINLVQNPNFFKIQTEKPDDMLKLAALYYITNNWKQFEAYNPSDLNPFRRAPDFSNNNKVVSNLPYKRPSLIDIILGKPSQPYLTTKQNIENLNHTKSWWDWWPF